MVNASALAPRFGWQCDLVWFSTLSTSNAPTNTLRKYVAQAWVVLPTHKVKVCVPKWRVHTSNERCPPCSPELKTARHLERGRILWPLDWAVHGKSSPLHIPYLRKKLPQLPPIKQSSVSLLINNREIPRSEHTAFGSWNKVDSGIYYVK